MRRGKLGLLGLVLTVFLLALPAGAQTDEVAPQAIDNDVVTDRVGLVDPVTGTWHLRGQGGAVASFFYGNPGDVPFMGDWNCDGTSTPGLYRQSDGFVYLRNSNTQGVANIRFFFGNPGDFPLAGDFDGDGCDTVSIYRASEARIYVINELGANDGGLGAADLSYIFGNPGDKPFVGDFDGDGIDTVGLHRESTGFMYFRNSHTQGNANAEFFFGDPGDRLVAGDWGIVNGVDTPAVFRPSNTTFFFRHTNTQGVADESLFWGQSNWLPVAGSWTISGGGGGGGGGGNNPPPPPPGPFCSNVTGITQGDCQALLAIYAAMGGPGWTNATGWALTKTPCTWAGVACSGSRVVSLILSPDDPPGTGVGGLVGTIPTALGNLTALTKIDFAANEIGGAIPTQIGNLINLQALDLSGNELTGAIPTQIGNLVNLTEELDLHENLLTGQLPDSMTNLNKLLILDLGSNLLSDNNINVAVQMTALQQLDLRENNFTGPVPSASLGALTGLQWIDLSLNGFQSFPVGIGTSTSLTQIDISNNALNGNIPSDLGDMAQLQDLDLGLNQMDNLIPDSFINLTQLVTLDLSGNQLNDPEVPAFNLLPGLQDADAELLLVPNTCIGTTDAATAAFILLHNPTWTNCSVVPPPAAPPA
jgi:hypothetical protein